MRPIALLPLLCAAACATPPEKAVVKPLPQPAGIGAIAAPRVSGRIDAPLPLPPVGTDLALPATLPVPAGGGGGRDGGGEYSLDFADTDIREVVAQILGTMLRVNYAIDPTVRGTATLRTSVPLTRAQLLPTLQALLAQNGAAVVEGGGLYRVLPQAAAAAASGIAAAEALAGAGSRVLPLRYASAEELAKVLTPFAGPGGRVAADPARNALILGGDPQAREALAQLAASFDVDLLANQSYALLPVASGDARDMATALQEALRAQQGGALAAQIRVVPMTRVNAVLVAAAQPQLIASARRVFTLIENARRRTVRSWHVFYLQNGRSNDLAYLLQQAFTPENVTAQPTAPGGTAPGLGQRTMGMGGGSGAGGGIGAGRSGSAGGLGASQGGGIGLGQGGLIGGGQQGGFPGQPQQPPGAPGQPGAANPLLGGLGGGPGNGEAPRDGMRIIPNPQNNAIVVYATAQEAGTVQAMLRRVDILPLQVRIDATIAEVTLNDNLRYGTQFLFGGGGLQAALTLAPGPQRALGNPFPGFVLGDARGSRYAIDLLQELTQVRVLSSPQLLVLDNEPARLQVGSLVPFLTQSAQSTLAAGAPVVNSVDYRETGVIMEVVPRVSSGGLVTLDVSQEVSDVDTSAPSTGISSPTFLERAVRSRVVVQDGQTIGLAGLIRDTSSRDNSGIPFLKDVPVLGALLGTQNNTRARTELLVLITPHVVHDQRDARALTEDLREGLANAAVLPDALRRQGLSGSVDPNEALRQKLRDKLER